MAAGPARGRMVLVVDPDVGLADAVSAFLPDDRVVGARTLAEASAFAEGGRVDLALVGPGFGTEDAVAEAAALREADRTLLTVLVADVPSNRVLRSALRAGFADVVDAPLSARKLADLLPRIDRLAAARSIAVTFDPPAPTMVEPAAPEPSPAASEADLPMTAEAPSPAGPRPVPVLPEIGPAEEFAYTDATGDGVLDGVFRTRSQSSAPAAALPDRPAFTPAGPPEAADPAEPARYPTEFPEAFPIESGATVAGPDVPPAGIPAGDAPFAPPPDTTPDAALDDLLDLPALPDLKDAADAGDLPEPPPFEPGAAVDGPGSGADPDAPPMPAEAPPMPDREPPTPAVGPVPPPDDLLPAFGEDEGIADEMPAAVPPGLVVAHRPATDRRGPSVHRAGDGRVITVMSGKGGSGKTITATNLAAALTERCGEDRVVLVDADLQFGDVALLLQLDPTRTIVDAAAGIDDLTEPRLDALLLRHESGLRLLAAPLVPASAERVGPKDVVRLVEMLRGMFPYVVVDTAPIFDDGLITMLEHSDDVLLVVDMDLPSVKNARIALDTLRAIGFDLGKVSTVVNRANSKARLDLAELERALGEEIAAEIPSDRLIPQSVNEGVPAVALSPRSRVAKAFAHLAGLFLNGGDGR